MLYSNSQDLYLNSLLEGMREEYEYIDDTMLYLLLRRLCEEEKATVIEDAESGLAVFTRRKDGKVFTLKIPDFGRY